MAVLNREELLNKLKERFGNSELEEDIFFIEDITDTYDDISAQVQTAAGEWESKYNDLKRKYRDRFWTGADSEGVNKPVEIAGDIEEPEDKQIDYKDLFEEK